jgi:hypothetical protein
MIAMNLGGTSNPGPSTPADEFGAQCVPEGQPVVETLLENPLGLEP